jgi:hypothetical protein
MQPVFANTRRGHRRADTRSGRAFSVSSLVRSSTLRFRSQALAETSLRSVSVSTVPLQRRSGKHPSALFPAVDRLALASQSAGMHLRALPNPSLSRDPTRQAAWASLRLRLCCATPPKRLAARVAVSSNVRQHEYNPCSPTPVAGVAAQTRAPEARSPFSPSREAAR